MSKIKMTIVPSDDGDTIILSEAFNFNNEESIISSLAEAYKTTEDDISDHLDILDEYTIFISNT